MFLLFDSLEIDFVKPLAEFQTIMKILDKNISII